jgi:hypothetical protein
MADRSMRAPTLLEKRASRFYVLPQQPFMHAGFSTSGRESPTNIFRFGILIALSVSAQKSPAGRHGNSLFGMPSAACRGLLLVRQLADLSVHRPGNSGNHCSPPVLF